jgi:hypothetical protein
VLYLQKGGVEMIQIEVGKHYTIQNEGQKLIILVTGVGQYEGEDVYFHDTITANLNLGIVFERDYEIGSLTNVKVATKEEIQEMRSLNPLNYNWIKSKSEAFIQKYWDTNKRPNIILDPDEEIEKSYYGAYEPSTESLIFRSEFLSILEVEQFEKILLHELCHWYLHVSGEEFRDKHVRFAKEIIRLGIEDTINMHNPEAKEAYEKAKMLP